MAVGSALRALCPWCPACACYAPCATMRVNGCLRCGGCCCILPFRSR